MNENLTKNDKFNYMLANEYIKSLDKAKSISSVANYNMSGMANNLIAQNEKLKDNYNNYLKLHCSDTFENSYLYQILKQNIEPNFNNLIEYGTNLKNNLKAIECQKYENTYNNLINLISYLQNEVIDVTNEDYKIIEMTFREIYDEYKMRFRNSEDSYIIHENNIERIINTYNNNNLTKNISISNNYYQSLKNAIDLVEQDINKMNELLESGLKKNNV